jgi:hypothetical protein
VHSPIPEIEGDDSDRVSTALHTATAEAVAPAMPDANTRHALDSEAWQAVLAQREAARLRSGTDVSLSGGSDTTLGSPLSKYEEVSSPISP